MRPVLEFDATTGDLNLGHGFNSEVVVYGRRDASTLLPETGETFFLDPLSWRFHDLGRDLQNGVPDRRAAVQLVSDFNGEADRPSTGDAPFQSELHTSQNRSTRVVEPHGSSALLSSLVRVIDSYEDQRGTLALVSKSRPFLGAAPPWYNATVPKELQGTILRDGDAPGAYDNKQPVSSAATNSDGSKGTQEKRRPSTRERKEDLRPEGYVWSSSGKGGLLGSFFESAMSQEVWGTGLSGTPVGPLVARVDAEWGRPNPAWNNPELSVLKTEQAATFCGPLAFDSDFVLAKIPNEKGGYEQRKVPANQFKYYEGQPIAGRLYYAAGAQKFPNSATSPRGEWLVGIQLPTPEQFKSLYKNALIPGPPGPKGPKGDRGPQGPPGKDGKNGGGGGGDTITDVTIDESIMLQEANAKQNREGGQGVACPNVGVPRTPSEVFTSTVPQGDDLNQQITTSHGWAQARTTGGMLSFGDAEGGIPIVPGYQASTVANWIPGQIGTPGGSTTLEGQVALLTASLASQVELTNSLMGGPNYFAGNLVAIHRNGPGNPPVGSTIGQWATAGADEKIEQITSPLEVLSILESVDNGVIDMRDDRDYDQMVGDAQNGIGYTTGVFTVSRETRGSGVTDGRSLVHLDNDRTQAGQVTGHLINTTDGAFSLDYQGNMSVGDVDADDLTQNGEGVVSVPEDAASGQVPVADGEGGYAFATLESQDLSNLVFGDGSDGSSTLGANLTITAPKKYANLTLAGYKLHTDGYLCQVSGTLDASTAGSQVHNGGADATVWGGTGAALTTGTAGPAPHMVGGGGDGGRASGVTSGGGGLAQNSTAGESIYTLGGGAGGAGGTGGVRGGSAGGTATDFSWGPSYILDWLLARVFSAGSTSLTAGGYYSAWGGGGGGGGGSDNFTDAFGGDGGAGGGTCIVAARTITGVAGTATVASVGGNGADPVDGGGGGTLGGGGGGGGGVAIAIFETATDLSFDCSGGTGAAGTGGGANNGTAGSAGTGYEINLTAGTITEH
jgi:hypothetical protein